MLSKEENELICRVGPGTPMGRLLREYWVPALTPDEVAPDGPPLRIRLLGENLIAFRTTSSGILIPALAAARSATTWMAVTDMSASDEPG